ncbi:uncharacterized protein LOC126555929 [Aphis gossypii]|uniref:uncharacterized protein LOC126555929 n=1 Tax=Aphis gossypii TaxID=80765 RepID=UPI0021597FC0|nr:uncharacterized protein LOC126555929 [Aphis gossypii]
MICCIFIGRSYLFVFIYILLLCVESIITKDTISSFVIPSKEANHNNKIHFNDQKKRKIESNIVKHVTKKNFILNLPNRCMENKLKSSKKIQNQIKVKKRESEYFKTEQVPAKSVWDFGGTWSSKLAGVRFVVDTHSTVGIDNSIPVKVLDMPAGTKSNGFLNKDWMVKASAQYSRLGPVSLSAINRADRNVAVFIGFVNSQNNKDFVTGMWSMGRNCKDNLETHQSVFNIPDVLFKDSNEQGD